MDFMAEWFTVSSNLTPRSSVGIGYAYGANVYSPGASSRKQYSHVLSTTLVVSM
jgi:hypothetical protein